MATAMNNGAYAHYHQQYQRSEVETADQGELVLMLYRGAIRFLQRAVFALRERNVSASHTNLVRAQDIVAELSATLNPNAGPNAGDVAGNLAKIYDYAHWRLVRANCQKDVVQAEEVLGIMQALLPSWEGAVRAARQESRGTRTAGDAR